MAGSYPDVPDHRWAHDRDGSVGVAVHVTSGAVLRVISGVEHTNVNSEATNTNSVALGGTGDSALVVIFPERRNLTGYRAVIERGTAGGIGIVESSVDTTTGIDGTWVSHGTWVGQMTDKVPHSKEAMRESIVALSLSNKKAVRFRVTSGGGNVPSFRILHLYGNVVTGENPHRLRFWQSAVDAEVAPAHFDLGDVPRGTSNTVAFRIKNESFSKTAYGVTVANEALTDSTPSSSSQHEYSLDGGTWTPTLPIGTLTPGEISGIVYARRNTSASVGFGLWWSRHAATATSWS